MSTDGGSRRTLLESSCHATCGLPCTVHVCDLLPHTEFSIQIAHALRGSRRLRANRPMTSKHSAARLSRLPCTT